MTVVVVEDVFIDFVTDHRHLGMLAQHAGQLRQGLLRIDCARRVGGAVEHQQPGAGRDGRRQGCSAKLVVLLLAGGNNHATPPGQVDHGGIAEPVGRRKNHLVTGIQQHLEQGVQRLLGPVADHDFTRAVGQLVVLLQLVGDGLPQGGLPRRWAVAGVASPHGLFSGPADEGRRRKIRLTGAEATNVLPLLL